MSTTMDTASFSSRRQAATTLPQFQLPSPGEIPSMPKPLPTALSLPSSFSHPAPSNSVLTPPIGVTSDLSPLSSTNTGSSQGSGANAGLSGYYSHTHGSWPTPGSGSSPYTFSSTNQQGQPLTQTGYGNRGVYGQSPSLPYGSRNPQSPATGGEGLPPPTYDQSHHQPYQSQMSGGSSAGSGSGLAASGGLGISQGTSASGPISHGPAPVSGPTGPAASSLPSQAPPPPSAILNSQSSASHQPPPSTSPVSADPYSRASPSQNYYTPVSSSHASSAFHQSYAPPTQPPSNPHAPATTSSTAPRPLSSMVPPTGMAPPQPYRPYPPQYSHMSHMGGPIMSNMGNPGGQMSLVAGVNVHSGYGQPMRMYSQGGHQAHQERPFRCDQCTQSFNRNHDLKRHKRIHLAVKPFPCTSCDKSFSRKDALKRHRLVKGCDADSSNKQDANKSNSVQDRTDPALGRPQSNDPNIKLENPRDMGARR